MSESLDQPKENSLNNPEKKVKPRPLFDSCRNEDCEADQYQITAVNGKITTHSKEPDCDYMICRCTECNTPYFYWIDKHWREQGILNGLPNDVTNDYAPDNIKASRLKYVGIELVKPVEITHRHERLIGNFATTMANCPDELLYQLVTDEGGVPRLPERWI